jgi:dTDP-4-amino-4,6-dideoxygalactose transaminase
MPRTTAVPLMDLKAQYATIKPEIDAAVLSVLESQNFTLGPQVEECEQRIAESCGSRYGIGVGSGSDALLISLMAEAIGPGDEVITTPYTFFATAGAILRLGATPVFVDICPRTFNLDVRQVQSKITARTKAIIPVHLFGQCAEMDPILELQRKYSLVVIEDAAQAIGAEYEGRRAGSMGDYGCFSFFPSKNLGCAGDGGMVVTSDAKRAEKLRMLRSHGSRKKLHHDMVGGNFRLDTIQAAIINVKLRYLETWTEARRKNATSYRNLFQQRGMLRDDQIKLPLELKTRRHVYHQFVIRTPHRDLLRTALSDQGIGTAVYYPTPLHLQPALAEHRDKSGDFPESEQAAAESLALPIFPELGESRLGRVVQTVTDVLRNLDSADHRCSVASPSEHLDG